MVVPVAPRRPQLCPLDEAEGQFEGETMDAASPLRACPGGVSVEVLASAGAADSKVRGLHGGALKVAVRAAPEKGKANAEVAELLAGFFGVSKRQVCVAAGQTSRKKRVVVLGVNVAQAEGKLRQRQMMNDER